MFQSKRVKYQNFAFFKGELKIRKLLLKYVLHGTVLRNNLFLYFNTFLLSTQLLTHFKKDKNKSFRCISE